MPPFKGLIFDFNGVLLLDQHLHDSVFKDIAYELTGTTPSQQEFETAFHGRDNKSIFEHLLGGPISQAELEERAREKEIRYQQAAQASGSAYRLAEGATTLIEALRDKKIPYTIATSSPRMNVSFFDEKLELHRLFDVNKIVCVEQATRGKPFPDVYLRAAEILSLPPASCVVIEDALSGIAAAQAAGIGYIIAIGPTERHDQLRHIEGVGEVIERLDQIDVEKLFG